MGGGGYWSRYWSQFLLLCQPGEKVTGGCQMTASALMHCRPSLSPTMTIGAVITCLEKPQPLPSILCTPT